MKWKTDERTLEFFIFVYILFSFEMGFFLEPLYHTKRHDNIFLPTHPPKTSFDVLSDKLGMDITPYAIYPTA